MSTVAEIVAEYLYADSTISDVVLAVRPVNLGATDRRPTIIYETVEMRSIQALNCKTNLYTGRIRFYVVADTHAQCTSISENVKSSLDGEGDIPTIDYNVTRIHLDDEEDITQVVDEKQKPFYSKALDFTVSARKLT